MRAPLLVLCLLTASAAADNPNQAKADQFFAEGRDLLMNKKDAKAACEKFEQAIELDPTAPGVMLNLGLCYELQEKYATSLHWFRKAQFAAAEAKPTPLTEYEDAAKQHTQDLSGKVLLAKIDERQAPKDVRIAIDNRPVRREEFSRLEVDSDSTIEARAPGKAIFRQKVEVEGGKVKDIVIVMTDEVIPPMRDPGKGRRRLAYIVGAAGVAVWGITLAYGLVVRSQYNDRDDGNYDDQNGYDDAQKDLRYKGTALFVAGTLTVGAAVVLYLTAPKPYREKQEQALVPLVSPDGVGIGYSRAF